MTALNSSRGRRRLGILRRRVQWLTERGGGDYDRAEASALRWALDILEELASLEQRALIERHGSTGGGRDG